MKTQFYFVCSNKGYYGLSMVTVEVGDNVFISGVVIALIEIPSNVFDILFMDRFGRKPICVLTFFLTGITCTPAGFLKGGWQVALAVAGQIFTQAKNVLTMLVPTSKYTLCSILYLQGNLVTLLPFRCSTCIQQSSFQQRLEAQLLECVPCLPESVVCWLDLTR